METVLAWTAVVACVGWGVAIRLWMNLKASSMECTNLRQAQEEAHNRYTNEMRRHDAIREKYDILVDSLKQKSLTAPKPQPKVKTWAGIRKANEAAIRKEDELNEKRERDTAFAE